ncbi:DUF4880 domain-containing protein [Gluconacetobacter sacchari]|uniref:DUF4880 domain-containing protein n=3 Tax=Gluconacetobacter sacchari TaxID=92759 RepID=A0A7W4IBN2_9PROT|nr:DUF4880 domain-containing protein [Gluconacetobacter sacchari]
MTPAKENPTPDAIAADWVTRMDRAALTAGEQEALNRWLGADIRHRGAMIRAQVVWQATERAAALRPGALPAPVLPAPVPPVAASASPPRRLSRRAMVAASVALAIGGRAAPSREMGRFYTVRDAAPRSVGIAGGTVRLDCFSGLLVGREAALLLEGRCVLSSRREARLDAGGLSFRSVGQVQVSTGGDRTSGLLLSGHAVAIRRGTGERFMLRAGDCLTLVADEPPRLRALTAEELAHATNWQRGVVELQGETLGDAAAIFNRYNGKKLVVHGQAGGRVLMGSFALDDPDAFARVAHAVLHVDYVASAGRLDMF